MIRRAAACLVAQDLSEYAQQKPIGIMVGLGGLLLFLWGLFAYPGEKRS